MTLAPITTAGSVQSTALYRSRTNGDKEIRLQQNGTLTSQTYIWQPWFITTRGRGTVAFDRISGDDDSQTLRGSGEATVSVFPRSKYPFSVSVSHIESTVEGDFAGTDFSQSRASATMRAVVSQSLNGRVTGSYDLLRRDGVGDLESQRLQFNVNKSFDQESRILGVDSIGFGASWTDRRFEATAPDDDDVDRQTGTVTLTMNSTPFEDVRYTSSYLFNFEDQDEVDDSFRLMSLQTVSTFQWRPKEELYVVTGTFRGLEERIDRRSSSTEADSDTSIYAGTIGMRWPVTERLNVNLGLRGAYESVNRDAGATVGEGDLREGSNLSISLLGGATYSSEERKLAGWDWRWNGRTNFDTGLRNEDGFLTRATIGVGHRASRDANLGFAGPVTIALDQEIDTRFDSDDPDQPIGIFLTNGVSLSKRRVSRSSNTSARLLVRDRRNLLESGNEFQLLQARWSGRTALDRHRSLQGNLMAQAVRQSDEIEQDLFVTASGSAAYNHRNLFDIENLSYLSELRLNIIDIDELFGAGTEDLSGDMFRNDWRNVVRYRIGQLSAQFEATGFHEDEGLGYLVLFRLRRDFSPSEL